MEYTAKEIIKILGCKYNDTLTMPKNLIQRAKQAQLIIELVPNTHHPYKYIIIEDLRDPNEIWVECWQYPQWEVSNLGNVRNIQTKKYLSKQYNQYGYQIIDARRTVNGVRKAQTSVVSVHRLVWFSFHPEDQERADQLQIDHKFGQRADNRLESLRAVSTLQNQQYKKENRIDIKDIINQLITKYGYDETVNKIQSLL